MFCEQCGSKVQLKANFCETCGARIEYMNADFNNDYEPKILVDNNNSSLLKDENKSFFGGIYHPWRRFFARTVDFMIIGIILLIVFITTIAFQFPQHSEVLFKFTSNPIFAGIIMYLLLIPVEALFLSMFGTTPAKWVFGIRITNLNGENLSYGKALRRSFLVFILGDCIGIPIVNLFTRFYAYRRLTKTGTTLWDSTDNEVISVVTHKKWGIKRAFFSTVLVFSTLIIVGIGNINNG